MDKGIIKGIIIGISALLAVAVLSYLIGRMNGRIEAEKAIVERVDTLFICDTIVQEKPVFVTKEVIRKELVPITDTLRVRDTLFVYLEREKMVWQDSLSRVHVSGIHPQVDSVEHFVKERVVTREVRVPVKEKSRWGIGLTAGYGVHFGNGATAAPFVGLGISYDLLSW
jgi:hypothetical protein